MHALYRFQFSRNMPRKEKDPRGEKSNIKRTGMLVGKFEKNPYEVPRFCFVGVA